MSLWFYDSLISLGRVRGEGMAVMLMMLLGVGRISTDGLVLRIGSTEGPCMVLSWISCSHLLSWLVFVSLHSAPATIAATSMGTRCSMELLAGG